MSRAGHASSSAVAPKQACRVPHTAASRAAVYGARRSGGTVRSAWLARGAAQKLRRSHAHCRSGSLGSWRSSASSVSSLSAPQARTYSGEPMGVPRATKPHCCGGRSPRQTSVPNSLDLTCHQIQGGTGTGWFGQKDIEVIEKRHERFTLPQLRISPSQRLVLAKCEKGGGKGVALFTSLSLGYAVADPVVVPPLVFTRLAVKKRANGTSAGGYIAQFLQKRGTGDAVVRTTPVQRNDGGSGIALQGCTEPR